MCQLQTLKAAAEKGKQAVGFGSVKVLKKSQNVFKVCCQHNAFNPQSRLPYNQPQSFAMHMCAICVSMHGPAEVLYKEAFCLLQKPGMHVIITSLRLICDALCVSAELF